MLTLRPYQREAIDACNEFVRSREDNPCIVLPTGAGKSLVMAQMLHEWISDYPPFRAIVLAHRKELVEQNAKELWELDNSLPIGIFAASLNLRDTLSNIIFASIDSVAHNAEQFKAPDVLLIDEAHRIPARGEGKYRKFIDAMKARNPRLRVIGLTATPYRLGTGNICHRDHILNEVCYDANLKTLIDDGYLCNLRTVKGEADIDLEGVKKSGGDFNLKDLALRVDNDQVVSQAVKHMFATARKYSRRSIIVFCIDIAHCEHVARELTKYGVNAAIITGKTSQKDRERLTEDFKAGRIQWLVSVNVFTEGFNSKNVDCVAMLRPTQSKGLWVQAVGRGLRLHPDKDYCLILDYGDNIARHGPIDICDDKEPKLETCGDCENVFARSVKCCPACGWEIPLQIRMQHEAAEERQRAMHKAIASEGQLLNEDVWRDVDGVTCRLHRKAGKPDSLRVDWHCGLSTVKEWVHLDHPGYAGDKAQSWLSQFKLDAASVADFLGKYTGRDLFNACSRILVGYDGKYPSVKKHEIKSK